MKIARTHLNSFIYFFSILLFAANALAQKFENIKIYELNAWGGPNEPGIAISEIDTNIMVVGSNLNFIYRSKNGGKKWKKKEMKSTYGVYGEPCIVSMPSGRFLYLHLSLPEGIAYSDTSFLDRIVCQTSNKKGKGWSKGSFMGYNPPADQDKEWAALDPVTGRVYASWTQFDTYGSENKEDKSNILLAYSDNQGLSWSKSIKLNDESGDCLDDDATTEGAVPAIGPNGEVYVAWALNEKIYFTASFDRGFSWLPKNIVTASQPGGWAQHIGGLSRTNGMPVTACDRSTGPSKGTVYVCWSDTRNGELNTDIFLTSSNDSGQTWSSPVRVNNDTGISQQFLPWMTIDQSTGIVYVVFYDRRAYPDNRTDVYLGVSKNGGQSFENIKISETPFTPIEQVFFGDYNNIAVRNGVIRPVWTRYENNKLSIWTAIVNL